MSNVKDFLKRKDIVITPQRYLIEALGAMAQGLFASLLIGTIIKTLGQQTGLDVLVDLGGYATAMSGPGQYFSARIFAFSGTSATIGASLSNSAICTISGLSEGLPFAA